MADKGQLERWAKEHDRAMLAVAARYAGPSTTAEDIRQSALLAILQRLEELGEVFCPKGLLLEYVKNVGRNHLRKRERREARLRALPLRDRQVPYGRPGCTSIASSCGRRKDSNVLWCATCPGSLRPLSPRWLHGWFERPNTVLGSMAATTAELWIKFRGADENWSNASASRDPDMFWDTIIEVVNLNELRVVGRVRLDEDYSNFVAPDVIGRTVVTPTGSVRYQVFRVSKRDIPQQTFCTVDIRKGLRARARFAQRVEMAGRSGECDDVTPHHSPVQRTRGILTIPERTERAQ